MYSALFAGVYHLLPAGSFGESQLGLGDSVYFSLMVHSTVGFGDIGPHTGMAKVAVSCHILVALLVLGGAFQAAEDAKAKEDTKNKTD